MNIGVFGSSAGVFEETVRTKAKALGKEVAEQGHVLITGACTGFPYDAVEGAAEGKGKVIGFSPAINAKEHESYFKFPLKGFTEIRYIPKTYPLLKDKAACRKYRNICSVSFSDACVFIGGRIGTLNEFTLAYDLGKPIGVLKGSGGVADDIIPRILATVKKQTGASIIFSDIPKELVAKLENLK